MTETLPDEAGTMPGLGPVPLLQRQSASNSRWTRTVPMASAALFVFGAILGHLVLQRAWETVEAADGVLGGCGSASPSPTPGAGMMPGARTHGQH